MLKALFKKKSRAEQTVSANRPPVIQRSTSSRSASRWASVMPPLGRRVRVSGIQKLTPDSVRVSLSLCDGGRLGFRAGQYLTHCFVIDGVEQRRAYSLCVPEGSEELAFACKRVDGGLVSEYICKRLREGDEYELRGPSGSFCLPEDEQTPLILIAAGSGITPVLSLLETALQKNAERSIQLLYANHDPASVMFGSRLQELQAEFANFHWQSCLSQAPADWSGLSGRIQADQLAEILEFSPQAQAYLCGPEDFMAALAPALEAAEQQGELAAWHQERFVSAHADARQRPKQAQSIRFVRSGQLVNQAPGQSILDAALAAGLPMDFSCTVGGCAACKVKVVSGRVGLDEPHCLGPEELEQGYTLACSAYALDSVELDA